MGTHEYRASTHQQSTYFCYRILAAKQAAAIEREEQLSREELAERAKARIRRAWILSTPLAIAMAGGMIGPEIGRQIGGVERLLMGPIKGGLLKGLLQNVGCFVVLGGGFALLTLALTCFFWVPVAGVMFYGCYGGGIREYIKACRLTGTAALSSALIISASIAAGGGAVVGLAAAILATPAGVSGNPARSPGPARLASSSAKSLPARRPIGGSRQVERATERSTPPNPPTASTPARGGC